MRYTSELQFEKNTRVFSTTIERRLKELNKWQYLIGNYSALVHQIINGNFGYYAANKDKRKWKDLTDRKSNFTNGK